jgi:putative acetyltransferase
MRSDIKIRTALVSDIDTITNLFKETIIAINAKDYGPEQVKVWSACADKKENWTNKIEEQYFLIAEIENAAAGFGSITKTGYLDFMYVHKDFQGMGIAKTLLQALEKFAEQNEIKTIISDVSITAKPFFENKGYTVIAEQKRILEGIELINYKMEKSI